MLLCMGVKLCLSPLMKEQRLMVFGNWVLRRILGFKMDEVTAGQTELHIIIIIALPIKVH